ncbi:MAG: hypothetical protein CMJ08_02690 [Pelagibacterales bacterium]|nr:hypothetical protein [Pelagibacterales bacterium]
MSFNFLESLNENQRKAVLHTSGPLLILAGAGTGKTRVLTTRLANILKKKLANPFETLTVTFTNKAASEMKHRVEDMLKIGTDGWWIGTFHAMGARILRKHQEIVGLKSQFSIIDVDDQIRLIKQALSYHNVDEKRWPARLFHNVIQRWKDKGLNPEDISNDEIFGSVAGKKIYRTYQNRLTTLNVVDYGDLLLQNLNIFKNNSEILSIYQKKFKYILVDEYQDTNVCQHQWLNLLAANFKNICAVGDDDQSIYSWRGAEVKNILKFEDAFKATKVIKLEENYRSTNNILEAANGLVKKNKARLGKNLWTKKERGEKIHVINISSSEEEARTVSDIIENLFSKGCKLSSMAILVRATYQTRFFEDRFIKIGLPYKIIGGTKFYERLEIKDAMAYLRLVVSDYDDLAFERIINVPKRGLGTKSLLDIQTNARKNNITLLESCRILSENNYFNVKTSINIKYFLKKLESWKKEKASLPASEIVELVLEESGYVEMWQNDKSVESEGRLENLKELVSAVTEFENLNSFLEHIQLVMDNSVNDTKDTVNLLTLHAAKGLEFDNIFLPGWEEEIFPNKKSIDEKHNEGLEEERRLAYVGITRAKKRVWILHANSRYIHGNWLFSSPSRFIGELPEENISLSNLFFNNEGKNNMSAQIDTAITHTNLKKLEDTLLIGDRVFHQKFGYGTIKNVEGDNAEVLFSKTNLKKVKTEFLIKNV